jgi:short-subunit dehydrogenase
VDFGGARVVITGASSGIGAGLAEELARRGARLGLAARRRERLDEVAHRCRSHGAEVAVRSVDIADADGVDELAAWVRSELGGVDVLVNNAGVPKRRHVTALDADTVERVMRVNYLAAVRLTLALLPAMVEQGAGRIVNMSSVAAPLSSPGEAAYDASKAALASFSEAMAVDLWDTGIHVLTVYPGVVDTELFSVPDNDPFTAPVEPITVDEMVRAILDALDRDALEVYAPAYFKDLAVRKAANTEEFLAGAAEFAREHSGPASRS